MKKFTQRLLSALLLLLATWGGQMYAETLTVHEGTTNNEYVPFYGYYADAAQHNQMIFPADELAAMSGNVITQMVFYIDGTASNGSGTSADRLGTWTVSLGETTATTLSGLDNTTTVTQVYQGYFDCSTGSLTLTFDDDYLYNGGNLLVDLNHAAAGWNHWYFLGEAVTGASYTYSSQRNFLPKTTFTYQAPPSCPKPTALAASNIQTNSAELSWTNGGSESSWKIFYKKATDDNFSDVTVNSNPYTLSGLDPATVYQFKVVAVCSSIDESAESAVASFQTECEAVTIDADHSYSENFDALTAGDNVLPICWSAINTTSSSTYNKYPKVYANSSYSTYAQSSPNCLYFYSYYSSYYSSSYDPQDQYAILPEMSDLDGKEMVLQARGYNSSSTIKVGLMSDPSVASTFDLIREQELTTSYAEYTFDLSGKSGSYIAIMIDAADATRTTNGAYIDDILVREKPACVKPAGLAVADDEDAIQPNSIMLQITAGESEETAWQLQYKKASDDEWTTLSEPVAENPFTLSGLEASTLYNIRVAAWCDPDEPEAVSDFSAPISAQTECAAITSFPWSENFEAYASGNFAAPCWVNEHISGNGTSIFKVYTSSNGSNSSHQLQLPDMSSGTLTKLILPEMTLPSDNYQFVLDVYRDASGTSYPEEGIRVFVSTDGEIEGATELAFISRNYSVSDNNLIPAENASGWYTYELPIGISGTCYIILRGESKWGSSTYMDNFFVEQIPTCKKPKAPACSAKTAHSATLSWTAGEDSQTAWEIAYSKLATFNPAEQVSDSIAAANANPFELTGLEQSTTYYAYVRANCGNDDFSAWSTNKVSFTTVSGHQPLTNLAVVEGSLGSSSVTVNWKSNANNGLHASYELYYSKLSSMPNELDADSLIENIADTFYVFNNLDPETQYYVWVRDNCGDDGLSEWSSRGTFTTTVNCPIPEGVSASDITAYTADIAWTIGEADGYTVQYRTAAGMKDLVLNEAFAASSIPSGWENKTGLLSGVMGGTTTLSSGSQWNFGASNDVFDSHARINIYGSSRYGWLISPSVEIAEDAVLNFDLALTAYSGSGAASGTCIDDKFVVLAYANETWVTLREWNNSGASDVYNDIPTTGTNVNIDLSAYEGQSVKIAFYGESTTSSNGDNNLHIDNVAIGTTVSAGEWSSVAAVSGERLAHLNALTPETKYEVQVKAACGGEDDWSESAFFTTEPITR